MVNGLDLAALPDDAPSSLTEALGRARSAIAKTEEAYKHYRKAHAEAAGMVVRYNNLVLEYTGQLKLFAEEQT